MTSTKQRAAFLTLIAIAVPIVWVIVSILGTLVGAAIAHADTPPAGPPPAPAPGWSMAEVMALIALIVAGVHALVEGARAILHFTAPRTKTTLDDRGAELLDSIHQRLTAIEALLPARPPAQSSTTNIIGPIAVLAIVLGLGAGSLSCATLRAAPGAAKTAAIECAKQDAVPIIQLAAQLGAQALIAAIDQGSIDWPALEAAAAVQGKVVGGCALTKFVAALSQAPRSDTAARALVAGPDPVADGKAAIARLSARFDGAVWQ